MDLVGVHGNDDLVAAARLGGGSHTSHQVLALVGQVQIDFGAHQLGNFHFSIDVAVRMLGQELLVVLDVLGTDADLQGLANVGVQLAVGSKGACMLSTGTPASMVSILRLPRANHSLLSLVSGVR